MNSENKGVSFNFPEGTKFPTNLKGMKSEMEKAFPGVVSIEITNVPAEGEKDTTPLIFGINTIKIPIPLIPLEGLESEPIINRKDL